MEIRRALITDLTDLRLLYADLLTEHPTPYPLFDADDLVAFTGTVAEKLASKDPAFICWVAEDDGTVVGFLLGEIMSRAIGKPRRYAVAHWLFVRPEYREQGLSRTICGAALEECQAKGAQAIEMAAVPGDPQWLNRGFQPTSVTFALPIQAVSTTLVSRKGASA